MGDLAKFVEGDYGAEVQRHFDAIEAEGVVLIKGVLGDWPDCVARPYCLADWNVRDSGHLCAFLEVGPPHHCSGYTPKEVKVGMMALVVDIVGIPEAYQGVVLNDGGVEIYQSRIYEGSEAKDMALTDAQDKLAEILSEEEEA